AIAAARFNEIVVEKLVHGALACFLAHGLTEDDVVVAWAPGAFDLPLLAKRLAETGLYDGVVCLGAVIRGETQHFDYVAADAARGIQRTALDTGIPILCGVLETDTMDKARTGAGGTGGT